MEQQSNHNQIFRVGPMNSSNLSNYQTDIRPKNEASTLFFYIIYTIPMNELPSLRFVQININFREWLSRKKIIIGKD